MEELPYYYVPWLDKKNGKPPSTHAPGNCSAFVATGSYTKDGKPVIEYGKYTSIWKKQADGSWKVVLDMGNASPAPKK